MCHYLLGLGINESGKPSQVILGDYPWTNNKIISIYEIVLYKDIENIALKSKHSFGLVGIHGALDTYTTYRVKNRRILTKSLTLLAKSQDGKYYKMCDGMSEPQWLSISDIKNKIKFNKYILSNSRLSPDEDKLIPLSGKVYIENFNNTKNRRYNDTSSKTIR